VLAEEMAYMLPKDPVALVFQTVDLNAVHQCFFRFAHCFHGFKRGGDFSRGLGQNVGHAAQPGRHGMDLVYMHTLRCYVYEVDDIIHGFDQLLNVFSVHWRYEDFVYQVDHVMSELVAVMLDFAYIHTIGFEVAEIMQHLLEEHTAIEYFFSQGIELKKKPTFLGHELGKHTIISMLDKRRCEQREQKAKLPSAACMLA
jgi:hypothetical protein